MGHQDAEVVSKPSEGDRMEGHNEECRNRIGKMMEPDGNPRTIGYDVRLEEYAQRNHEASDGGVDRQNKNTRYKVGDPAGAETIEDDDMKDDDLERYRNYGRNEEGDAMKENEWKADAGIEEDERMMAVTRRKIAMIQMERDEAKKKDKGI